MQIAEFNEIGVHYSELANSCCGQIAKDWAAKAASTDDHDPCRGELCLTRRTDLGQKHLPLIAQNIVRRCCPILHLLSPPL